jgi:hypothetical protein
MVFNEDQGEKGHKAVFGIFDTRSSLETTVESLKKNGFKNTDISVLMPTPESTKNFAHEKSTKAPEGVTVGATSGLAIGGVLGWLAGIGALAIPGIGPFVAAGPIVAAIAGAGLGGALGGITGALIGLGIPEYEAKRYEALVKEGGMLLSVHVADSDLQKKAKEILKVGGAKDIATSSEELVKPPKPGKEYHPPA